MMEYQVGDLVKMNNKSYYGVGQIGIITRVGFQNYYVSSLDQTLPVHNFDLENKCWHGCFFPEEFDRVNTQQQLEFTLK
jgi:hypothetical protein